MRIERVVLKHHGNVAVLRRNVIHDTVADRDRTLRNLLQAGDHPERRRLPASRWSYKHNEFLIFHFKIDAVHRNKPALIHFLHIVQYYSSHDELLFIIENA